jgi:hypothetical protein
MEAVDSALTLRPQTGAPALAPLITAEPPTTGERRPCVDCHRLYGLPSGRSQTAAMAAVR